MHQRRWSGHLNLDIDQLLSVIWMARFATKKPPCRSLNVASQNVATSQHGHAVFVCLLTVPEGLNPPGNGRPGVQGWPMKISGNFINFYPLKMRWCHACGGNLRKALCIKRKDRDGRLREKPVLIAPSIFCRSEKQERVCVFVFVLILYGSCRSVKKLCSTRCHLDTHYVNRNFYVICTDRTGMKEKPLWQRKNTFLCTTAVIFYTIRDAWAYLMQHGQLLHLILKVPAVTKAETELVALLECAETCGREWQIGYVRSLHVISHLDVDSGSCGWPKWASPWSPWPNHTGPNQLRQMPLPCTFIPMWPRSLCSPSEQVSGIRTFYGSVNRAESAACWKSLETNGSHMSLTERTIVDATSVTRIGKARDGGRFNAPLILEHGTGASLFFRTRTDRAECSRAVESTRRAWFDLRAEPNLPGQHL